MSSKRKIVIAFVLSLAGGVLFAAMPSEQVHAIGGTGYFSGQRAEIGSPNINQNDVIAPRQAIPDYVGNGAGNDKAQFISWLDSHVDRNDRASGQNEVGGAFIVNTMLNHSRSERSKTVSSSMWNELVDRINNPDIRLQTVTGDPNSYSPEGSFYDPSGTGQDDFFTNYNGNTRPLLLFRDRSGTVLYVLEVLCANPLGRMPGLPEATSPATVDAQSFVNGSSGDVNVSAADGDVRFLHRIRVTNYDGENHRVRYRVQRSISDSGNCNGTGFTTIRTGSIWVNRNGNFNVWGTATVNGWNRNTTERICQQLRITSRDGANLRGSAQDRARANIMDGNITVTASADENYVEPGQDFGMRGQVRANAQSGTPYRLTYDIAYTVTGIPGLSGPSRNGSTMVTSSSYITRTRDFNGTIPNNAPAGGTICLDVTVSRPTQDRYFSPSGANTDSTCVTVVHKPIISVNGGDVAAGPGFAPACTSTPDAGITGWNTNSGAYDGAGTQFAAFALGKITGFASAKINSSGATPPRSLAFANTPASSGEEYGGEYGFLPCITDHYGLMPEGASSLPSLASINSSTSSGAYQTSNGNNLPSTMINSGTQLAVYVDDDVYISGNIVYNRGGGWSMPADIPGFKLVVNGDIYIRNTVTELNGIYIAQGDGTNGGNIYTCAASPGNAVNTGNTSNSNLFDRCTNPLVVNGVFVAHKVYFTRTHGTSLQNTPAEQFNYLPELWLTRWPDTAENNATKYDAITGLPPIL